MADNMTVVVRDSEGLAVCIPTSIVSALDLSEGEEIMIRVLGDKRFQIAKRAAAVSKNEKFLFAPDWIDVREIEA